MNSARFDDHIFVPSQSTEQQHSINNQSIQLSSIQWANEDDEIRERRRTRMSGYSSICCGCVIGSLLVGIALAVILTIWLRSKPPTITTFVSTTTSTITTVTSATASTTSKTTSTSSSSATTSMTTSSTSTSTTSTSTSMTTSSTSTSTTSTSTSTTTSTSASTSTSATTSTTTVDPCTILRWNLTGTIVAGTGTAGTAPDRLNAPRGIYIDSNDTLYICDYGNHRIQKWILGASNGSTIAGNSNGIGGVGLSALKYPIDLIFDKNGYLYVVDYGNHRVQSFGPNSTIGVTVAGITGSLGSSASQLNNPSGIDIDKNLNLYIADTDNQRVMKWAPNATNGTIFVESAALKGPYGIIFTDTSLNQVYISDYLNDHIQLWSSGATQANKTLAGVNSGDMNYPTAFKFDPYGNLYVASILSDDVRKFCAGSTTPIIVVGSSGTTPSLANPASVAFDSNYNLYVADTSKDFVVKFSRL